jgi:uncharacterized protein with HEPN domain
MLALLSKVSPKKNFLADRRTQQAVILGMRNRLAHGYFDINLDVVWDTVSTALPSLLESLPVVLKAAREISGD